jgi:pimeloyl-ACP methyl ester carboxylesterase
MVKVICVVLMLAVAGTVAAQPAVPAKPAAEAPGLPGKGAAGSWLGALDLGSMKLRLALEVTAKDGKLEAVLDSIDQNAKLPVTTIEDGPEGLRFAVAPINGSYEGKYSSDGAELIGTWTQAGNSLPLTFRRQAGPFALKRPQEPAKPYPYREEEVAVQNSRAGVSLSGTLTLPDGKGPFPAVVLMSGSGPQDRNETLMGHKPFLVLADHLTRAGIAVLRYDDRGFGKSSGNFAAATHVDFASDGRAAFEYLKTRPEIDGARIGLLGHSEGSVYAPYIAREAPDVAFVVLYAGVGVPMRALLDRQGMDILKAMGLAYTPSAEEIAISDAIFQRLALKKIDQETADFLRAKFREALAVTPENVRRALNLNEQSIEMRLQTLMTPWFMELLSYDAGKELGHIRVPVLALFGSKDTQVAAEPNSDAMKKAFAAAGNRDVTLKTFDGLNHLFQHAATGAPGEYSSIEETMAPAVLETTSKWILQKTAVRK